MTLQEKLDLLKMQRVPMPLVGMQAVTQALILRRAGLPYTSIATVMREYHGSSRSTDAWRRILRNQGAAPKHYANSQRAFTRRAS